MRVLAGDIGGTNSRLALVEISEQRVEIVHRQDFPSTSYPGLEPIVLAFLRETGERPQRACFGVPCPVTEDPCELTNLRWTLDPRRLRREIGIPATILLNDFAALGLGIPLLGPESLVRIKPGDATPREPIAYLGAGTGLGQGALVWIEGRYHVVASEGGHVDLAPRTDLEIELLQWLRGRHGRVSWERVLSGPGIGNLYRFLVSRFPEEESALVRDQVAAGDPAAVIVQHALDRSDALATRTMELFVSAYGAQAGNLALAYRAVGGVFLAGGIAPRIVSLLQGETFRQAFTTKGRLSPMVARIPVHVIAHDAPAILGAARAAADLAAAP